MDSKKLFIGKSEDYSSFRPSYPDAAISWLRERCSGERVVDIGAGTGIFTKALLRFFKDVTAVEPNDDMLSKFSEILPHIPIINGTGEATGLSDNSVDLITVAQAFHWLDEDKFKSEATRILSKGGKVAIIWNTSLENEFTKARDNICKKHCPRFRTGYAGKRSPAEGDTFLRFHYFRKVEVAAFSNPFTMSKEVFEGNMRSRSYFPIPSDQNYKEIIKELDQLFDIYATDGSVTEPLETQIFLGEF